MFLFAVKVHANQQYRTDENHRDSNPVNQLHDISLFCQLQDEADRKDDYTIEEELEDGHIIKFIVFDKEISDNACGKHHNARLIHQVTNVPIPHESG